MGILWYDWWYDWYYTFINIFWLIWLVCCFSFEDKLRWMFSLYDINKDGVLSPTEIRFVKLSIDHKCCQIALNIWNCWPVCVLNIIWYRGWECDCLNKMNDTTPIGKKWVMWPKKGVWPSICLFREEEEKILREVSHCLNKINDMTPIGKKKRCVWPIWWRWVTRQKKVCVCDLFGGDEWHDQKKVCVWPIWRRGEKRQACPMKTFCALSE